MFKILRVVTGRNEGSPVLDEGMLPPLKERMRAHSGPEMTLLNASC